VFPAVYLKLPMAPKSLKGHDLSPMIDFH
jgi:hypothetical protein